MIFQKRENRKNIIQKNVPVQKTIIVKSKRANIAVGSLYLLTH